MPLLLQGVVTAATGAGVTLVLRRALTGTGMGPSGLGQVRTPGCHFIWTPPRLFPSLAPACWLLTGRISRRAPPPPPPPRAHTHTHTVPLQPTGKEGSVSAAAASSSATMVPSAAAVAPPLPPAPPPPQPDHKPANDVVAGAMARAASQSTIHPLDTMKVRMQAGGRSGITSSSLPPSLPPRQAAPLERRLLEVKGLYKARAGASVAGCTAARSRIAASPVSVRLLAHTVAQQALPCKSAEPCCHPAGCRVWWVLPRAQASSSAPTLPSTPPPSASCARKQT